MRTKPSDVKLIGLFLDMLAAEQGAGDNTLQAYRHDLADLSDFLSGAGQTFVTATTDVPGYFSDNAVTLLPGRETRLTFTPRLGAKVSRNALASGLKVRHLRQTY